MRPLSKVVAQVSQRLLRQVQQFVLHSPVPDGSCHLGLGDDHAPTLLRGHAQQRVPNHLDPQGAAQAGAAHLKNAANAGQCWLAELLDVQTLVKDPTLRGDQNLPLALHLLQLEHLQCGPYVNHATEQAVDKLIPLLDGRQLCDLVDGQSWSGV